MKTQVPKGSRLLAWATFIVGATLSGIHNDPTYFTISTPAAIGLYMNKQYQERKTAEVKQKN